MAHAGANGLGTITNLKKIVAFLKSFVWHPVYGEKVERNLYTTVAFSTIGWHIPFCTLRLEACTIGENSVSRDLSRTWEMTYDLSRLLDFIYIHPIVLCDTCN